MRRAKSGSLSGLTLWRYLWHLRVRVVCEAACGFMKRRDSCLAIGGA